jgi:pyruvate,water dikinase
MAILAMFDTGDSLLQHGTGVKRVEGSNQYYVHVVDLGGGTTADAANKRTITCDQITSRPFCALWRGMTSEEFPRPPVEAVQGRSLAALLANTITPGTRALGFPNYACVTDTYVNLNSRQAYHYAVVDAFLSDTANSNHVSVRLKGGGAAAWQRNLRARFMCNVLRLHGFVATATGDVLNAWCRGIGAARGEQLLTTVGRVLRFSGQLDLLMDDEASVEKYLDAFTAAEREVAADRTVETPA